MLHAAGKLQIAQEEEAQAIKLVKTLQSKLAATSAATAALAADQALLAASLDKLSAREKELLDSKGFMEGKRLIYPGTANHKPHMQTANANHKCKPQMQTATAIPQPLSGKRAVRVKEVSQLEDSLKAERSSADNDVTQSKARVIELQAAVQASAPWQLSPHCVYIFVAEARAKARGNTRAGAAAGAGARQLDAAVRS